MKVRVKVPKTNRQLETEIVRENGLSKEHMDAWRQFISGRPTTAYPVRAAPEAIEAQKAMVGSPNHTTICIPVGPMGVRVVQTLEPPATK